MPSCGAGSPERVGGGQGFEEVAPACAACCALPRGHTACRFKPGDLVRVKDEQVRPWTLPAHAYSVRAACSAPTSVHASSGPHAHHLTSPIRSDTHGSSGPAEVSPGPKRARALRAAQAAVLTRWRKPHLRTPGYVFGLVGTIERESQVRQLGSDQDLCGWKPEGVRRAPLVLDGALPAVARSCTQGVFGNPEALAFRDDAPFSALYRRAGPPAHAARARPARTACLHHLALLCPFPNRRSQPYGGLVEMMLATHGAVRPGFVDQRTAWRDAWRRCV